MGSGVVLQRTKPDNKIKETDFSVNVSVSSFIYPKVPKIQISKTVSDGWENCYIK